MLPKNGLVRARKAVEKLYDGICTVTERQEYEKENTSTGFKEVVVLENHPCRLSFGSSAAASDGQVASSISQVTELFISPDIVIAPGSKITVTQNGVTTDYTRSGKPAVYATHQQIALDLWKGWS